MGTNEVLTTSFINQLMNNRTLLHLGQEIVFTDGDKAEAEEDSWDDE